MAAAANFKISSISVFSSHLSYILAICAAKLASSMAELEELRSKSSDGAAGDLPEYIVRCETEIGALSRRIAQLREEIAWAESEIEARKAEGAKWDRLLNQRQSDVGEFACVLFT